MRLRTKLFLIWSAILPLLWVPSFWSVERNVRSRFDEIAQEDFDETKRDFRQMQKERIARMRQSGQLVMSIPELRALIAENGDEIDADNIASLQERLNYLKELVGVSFLSVLNRDGRCIAESGSAPWKSAAEASQYDATAPESSTLIQQIFSVRSPSQASRYGLWRYAGRLYEVVGVPLIFDSNAGSAVPDGALLLGAELNDQTVLQLGESHNSLATFFCSGHIIGSNLNSTQRQQLQDLTRKSNWGSGETFTFDLGRATFHGSIQPVQDPASGHNVAEVLIQCDLRDEQIQSEVLRSLLTIMLCGLLAAALASYLVSTAVTWPVRILADGVRRVALGDLAIALPVHSRDELGQLSESFNDMVSQLRTREELKRQMEQAQAASRAKGQFLANMSHEIRTPLNGVVGMTELLLGTQLDARQRRYASVAKSSAELLTTLINDVLDFSKIEAGRMELECIDFDLQSAVNDVIDLLMQRATARDLRLGCEFNSALPRFVRGDPGRLRQILVNLVSNAIKFTEAGSVTVRAAIESESAEKFVARFAVIDTGIGIPEDRRDRLFRPFSQVDASMTRKFGGTGLGLAISKELAELMGGRIGVETQTGKGSEFWFTAALIKQPAGAAHAREEAAEHVIKPTAAGRKILLAEDNEVNQLVATEFLTQAGYECIVVDNGSKAVDACLAGQYDLVLMDCQMPVMDGFAATRLIRENEVRLGQPRVPIVALTASAIKGDRELCLQAGMDAYCSKPINLRELLGTMDSLLIGTAPATGPAVAEVQPAAAPIVVERLLAQCSMNVQVLGRVLDKFELQAKRDVEALTQHLAAGDATAAAKTAHALKGAAAIIAAERLTSLAADLEKLGRESRLDEMAQQMAELRQQVSLCLDYLPQARAAANTTQPS
jgi:signal transduction histidine kinase/CheY-like chemotaxis protein